jgi:hypothetical protein
MDTLVGFAGSLIAVNLVKRQKLDLKNYGSIVVRQIVQQTMDEKSFADYCAG